MEQREMKRKAKEMLRPLDGMSGADGLIIAIHALAFLIRLVDKPQNYKSTTEDVTALLKTLLIEEGDEQ